MNGTFSKNLLWFEWIFKQFQKNAEIAFKYSPIKVASILEIEEYFAVD